jgi:NADPH:quinone reductase-like Zn-dependent oxidoreductase
LSTPSVGLPFPGPTWLGCAGEGGRLRAAGAGQRGRRRIGVLAVRQGAAHFAAVTDMCVSGDVDIHIDRTFGLDDVPEALAHVGEGHALGKVIITPD